jgi:hypothetical protein
MNLEYSKVARLAAGVVCSALMVAPLGCGAGDEAVSLDAESPAESEGTGEGPAVDQDTPPPAHTAAIIQVQAGEVSNRLGVQRWEVEPGTDIRGFGADGQVIAAFHLDNVTQLLESILPDAGLKPVGPAAKDEPDTFTPRSTELYESFRTDLASDPDVNRDVDKVISFRGCFASVSACVNAAQLIAPVCFSCIFDNTGQFCSNQFALFTGSSPFDCL